MLMEVVARISVLDAFRSVNRLSLSDPSFGPSSISVGPLFPKIGARMRMRFDFGWQLTGRSSVGRQAYRG